jgi:iron complex outermembrane receptor protein
MLAQVSSSWLNALHVTGGLRVEDNDAFSGRDHHPLLPLLGAAFVHSFGGLEVKVRSSFGRGIRPPNSPVRGAFTARPSGFGSSGAPAGLDPEVQTGFESGVEMYVGQELSLHATRFDQRATGLIQNVLVGMDTESPASVGSRRMRYQLENVGEISNRGWELQGMLQRGALGVSGTFATVDSRVMTVSGGYLGDLRPGDRMLAVPARTASLSAWWTAARWSASLTASRASDWVNYDRVALARAYSAADGLTTRNMMGVRLRDFWRAYDGQTHLRVSAMRDLGRGLSLVGTGENLLGGQLGEPDNLTIRAGRALTGGFRASF